MSYNPGVGYCPEYGGAPLPSAAAPTYTDQAYSETWGDSYQGNSGEGYAPYYNTGSSKYFYSDPNPRGGYNERGYRCNTNRSYGNDSSTNYTGDHGNYAGDHGNYAGCHGNEGPGDDYYKRNDKFWPPVVEESYEIPDTLPTRKKAWGSGGRTEHVKAKPTKGKTANPSSKKHSAAGKHPLMILKEAAPSITFEEVARERNDTCKFYRLVAAVTINNMTFEGEGVTIKIAKGEAACRALEYLGVSDLDKMMPHIPPSYEDKQRLMKANGGRYQISAVTKCGNEVAVDKEEVPTLETHPVMFLHQLYGPGIEVVCEEEHPGFKPLTFSCTITVQGQSFQAQGPSKKTAQQITSALILERFKTHPPPITNQPSSKKRRKQDFTEFVPSTGTDAFPHDAGQSYDQNSEDVHEQYVAY